MKKSHLLGTVCVSALLFVGGAHAAIIAEYTELATYNAAVGAHTIIDFNDGYPDGTVVTDQYIDQGAFFFAGNDEIFSDPAFLADGVGLQGFARIDITFSTPMNHIGVEFPGALDIVLYSGSTIIDVSSQFGGTGSGLFGGVISSAPFDRVVLHDWADGSTFIDNLHFGTVAAAPVPAAAWLFGSGLLGLIAISSRKKAV